ncbi:formyltetrahydrofolate deformylase [Cytobacillus horneckiae]|uniref:Formyltetrahydrofolate deformylase n=1 Tax=Cytobacillus horneckiae TaxID=549687 RepID=A0A2N0ZGH4_9BACI|nr:formyltetrahydrofolate deformylase [Cytobacillus horneckiae]NRG45050.1 formyltetrahydrofolate deformylase [Bacillus sp. CRN 9]MBN6888262.1 formyltetrahydrofolate deformylase [Cytobacillus horneckiae]MCM3177118.1 formyltetrahydrofolate deformylase [Cytobacillus horneckiae]MEC1154817.1 formyltetrahydrofolate deformylase [Cytobacillus horneckiae]MED2940311.1 formyltetrahydrofolate deformylase [Cytobacillus horneckiae]
MNSVFNLQSAQYKDKQKNRGRLLINCPDQPGIVATVSKYLFQYGANIIESNQYSTNHEGGSFFIRIEFECPNLQEKYKEIEQNFQVVANDFSMDWRLQLVSRLKRTAIFVSKELHCLREILLEWQNGDMMMEIPLVISNHEAAKELVESHKIPFYHIPATKENRQEAESQHLKLLEEFEIDVIILARYMQILTPNFVSAQPNKIINIHHSFLPAFVGARPYDRAYERGVKIIGATSHYVTNDLDEGPIIEQDIRRVDHRDHVEDLKRTGRSIERSVLARAVKWHLEDRIIVHGNKTVVF